MDFPFYADFSPAWRSLPYAERLEVMGIIARAQLARLESMQG